MKKSFLILGAVSIILSFLLCSIICVADIQVVDARYVDVDGNFLFLENDMMYQLDKTEKILFQKKLSKKQGTHTTDYENITKDSDGNIYLIANEIDEEGFIFSQSVIQFSENGKKQKQLFSFDLYENFETIYKIQSFKNKLILFTADAKNILYMKKYNPSENKIEEIREYEFEVFPDIRELIYTSIGSIYYTDYDNNLYCLYNATTNEYNQKIDIESYGFLQSIPDTLSYDKQGNVYYNDICTLRFIKYNEKENTLTQVYEPKEEVAEGFEYQSLVRVQIFNDTIIAQSNTTLLSDNFIFLKHGNEFTLLNEKRLPLFHCIILFFISFIVCFFLLALLLVFFNYILHAKSILVKQISVITPLFLLCSFVVAFFMRYYLIQNMTNEAYFQLYTLSSNFAEKIDSEKMKMVELPLNQFDSYYKELEKELDVNITEFYEAIPKAIRRQLYYNVSVHKEGKDYILLSNNQYQTSHLGGILQYYLESNDIIKHSIQKGEIELKIIQSTNKVESMFCVYNVKDSLGEVVGKIEVGLAYTDYKAELEHTVRRFLLIILAIMLFIHMVLIVMVNITLRGLNKLKQGVNDISEGNWNTVVDIHSNDELQEIGNGFNKMTKKVKLYLNSIENLNLAYEKFVPREILSVLNKDSILDIHLGDYITKNMSVLTITTRNFYQIAEKMTTAESFIFLNQLYCILTSAVHHTNGIIEDYRSAGIRAIYDNSVDRCIDCVLEILEKIGAVEKNIFLNAIIQRGDVMFGITGTSQRTAAVAVSDILNYTFMLEEMAQTNDINLILTDDAYHAITHPENYKCRYIGRIKNKKENHSIINVFEVLDAYSLEDRKNKLLTMDIFHKGIEFFIQGNLEQARKYFIDVIHIDKNDKLAQSYIFLCDKFMNCLPDNWFGYYM